MSRRRTPTLASVLIAVATVIGLLAVGDSIWLALAVAVLWIGSLWLTLPEPELIAPRLDPVEVSRDAVRDTIEQLEHPVLLLEGTRIAMANAAARAALGPHVVGQDARIALRHPDAVRVLDVEEETSVTISGLTGGRSLWQLTRRRIKGDRWLIELADRTAETDIGRAHTDFVANASHELRTPLASIIGYAETLADAASPADPAISKRFIGTIQREAQRMLALVEDLMMLSRVEAEKHDSPSERLDLAALAARVVGEVSSIAGNERVEAGALASEAMILGDPGQIEQLLRNLIDNAFKYGAADAPVTVSVTTPRPGSVRLAVADRGPGIAAEHLPLLTRRFYRIDPGRSRASGGTGLGLAIVKHIVERHGGELDIASKVGEGTTACVTLRSAPSTLS